MRITTPLEIEQVAWEGILEPPGQSYKRAEARPKVTLGRPDWWPAEAALAGFGGQPWTPPAGDRRYTLVRLACTLHPFSHGRARYAEATLAVYLRPSQGDQAVVAHALYPVRLSAETTGKLTVDLGPELKFAKTLEAKVGSVGAEIDYRQVYPVIQAYGLGERNPYWRFAHHGRHPLLGSQYVYLVLAAPAETPATRLSLELTATVQTRFGPLRLGTPQEAIPDHLSWTIG